MSEVLAMPNDPESYLLTDLTGGGRSDPKHLIARFRRAPAIPSSTIGNMGVRDE